MLGSRLYRYSHLDALFIFSIPVDQSVLQYDWTRCLCASVLAHNRSPSNQPEFFQLCSPTRTSLLSGRYPYTIGMNGEVGGNRATVRETINAVVTFKCKHATSMIASPFIISATLSSFSFVIFGLVYKRGASPTIGEKEASKERETLQQRDASEKSHLHVGITSIF